MRAVPGEGGVVGEAAVADGVAGGEVVAVGGGLAAEDGDEIAGVGGGVGEAEVGIQVLTQGGWGVLVAAASATASTTAAEAGVLAEVADEAQRAGE